MKRFANWKRARRNFIADIIPNYSPRRYEPVTPGWLMDYLHFSLIALKVGLIEQDTLIERLNFALNDDVDNLEHDQGSSDPERSVKEPRRPGGEAPSDPLLHFRLPSTSPQADWLFSIKDTDPLPSIPHGHWKTHASQRKLDPYLGHIYEGRTMTTTRLSWKECNRFWRSPAFRGFAKRALEAAIADPRMSAAEHIAARTDEPYRLPR